MSVIKVLIYKVITWYTVYIAYAIEQLKAEGQPVNNEDVSHQWPTKFAVINVHGKIGFNIAEELKRKDLGHSESLMGISLAYEIVPLLSEDMIKNECLE